MKNDIARTTTKLIPAVSAAIGGLTEHGETLQLLYVTKEEATDELEELIAASNEHREAKHELRSRQKIARSVAEEARRFGALVRDIMKLIFGSQHSSKWEVLALPRSLTLPRSIDGLIAVMMAINGHLATHPELENAPLNLTAVRALALTNDLVAAKNAVAH